MWVSHYYFVKTRCYDLGSLKRAGGVSYCCSSVSTGGLTPETSAVHATIWELSPNSSGHSFRDFKSIPTTQASMYPLREYAIGHIPKPIIPWHKSKLNSRDMIVVLNTKQNPPIVTCTKKCAVMCYSVVWLEVTDLFVGITSFTGLLFLMAAVCIMVALSKYHWPASITCAPLLEESCPFCYTSVNLIGFLWVLRNVTCLGVVI